ncbi:TonB family protein [Massilibacteroides vaginae]|uniref:TonB family protein n=1 Tax=Massilibacteroides vaginae TaxID=1673718 RepID=UPI000A1CDAB4|nr:M56 family metallopeptidase [Massilibacteroides vaginae]
MTPELAYFVKINIAFILLYGFYRLFFYKDTYFTLRRITLLTFYVLAFSYPLFNIQEWVKVQQQPIAEVIYYYSSVSPEIVVEQTNANVISWGQIINNIALLIYVTVAGCLLIRFIIQLASILRIKRLSKRSVINGIPVYLLPKPAAPFSFFRSIFVYPDSHSEKELEEILMHECTHVAQWHSIDVIFSELISICCWVNPFVWLLKREVRHNLEYLADNTVIHSGYDSKTYQFHLLGLMHQQSTATLYNNFNVLDLKNRIMMMNKKRSSRMGRAKYLIFLPFAALLLQFCNIDRTKQESTSETTTEAGSVKVSGTVVDTNGNAIAGANVIVDGTDTGTITDLNGNFELQTDNNATLSVSFINYDKENRSVSSVQATPTIILKPAGQSKSRDQVFTVVEEMPKFPGGEAKLLEFINKGIKYPVTAQEKGIQGRVIASFIVNKDGSVSDVEVVRGVDPLLDTEAVRVISTFPNWEPGKQRGQAVDVKYTVPITFRLSSGGNETASPNASNQIKGDVYTVVEEMPRFPGGEEALLKFINQGIKYPTDAQEGGKQGRVIVSFTVKKDGSVADVEVMRGVYPSLDKEAMRVIGTMPIWEPGKEKGQAVNVRYTVPITFRLQ